MKNSEQLNSYFLTKRWFAFCGYHPHITPVHTALYLWLVECNNQQSWKEYFLFSYIGIEKHLHISHKTFKKSFENLIYWGFLIVHCKPSNGHSNKWMVAFTLGEIPTVNNIAMEKNPMVTDSTLEKTPTANGVTMELFPTELLYNNKTSFSKNFCREENLTHEKLDFNNFSISSNADKQEEKKKGSAEKRKEVPERKAAFKTFVFAFAKQYPTSILQAFYEHWSETNSVGQMRYELEPTWELPNRLNKWLQLEQKFNKSSINNTKSNNYDTEQTIDYSVQL